MAIHLSNENLLFIIPILVEQERNEHMFTYVRFNNSKALSILK